MNISLHSRNVSSFTVLVEVQAMWLKAEGHKKASNGATDKIRHGYEEETTMVTHSEPKSISF